MVDRNEKTIVVEDLRKNFGQVRALRGINLSVGRGEIFGLLGANGAGKTTLIRALVGATRPTAGRLEVLGMRPDRQRARLRKQIGYMPQQQALYEDLTARDNVRFFAQAQRMSDRKERIDEMLALVELSERQHDLVYGFSGGMKQRVSLACALIQQPRILFLDEPTAGVDPKLRETFWQHFRALSDEGVTIVISTHQMDEALHCDRLAIMQGGVILADDSPQQLLWGGEAQVKIWRNETVETKTLADYPSQLPGLLQKYHLDSEISRIELEVDTLEDIVLRMIKERDQ